MRIMEYSSCSSRYIDKDSTRQVVEHNGVQAKPCNGQVLQRSLMFTWFPVVFYFRESRPIAYRLNKIIHKFSFKIHVFIIKVILIQLIYFQNLYSINTNTIAIKSFLLSVGI